MTLYSCKDYNNGIYRYYLQMKGQEKDGKRKLQELYIFQCTSTLVYASFFRLNKQSQISATLPKSLSPHVILDNTPNIPQDPYLYKFKCMSIDN